MGVQFKREGLAWCSHLCYIGAWDDQCSRLGPKRPESLSERWKLWGRLTALVLTCGGALAMLSRQASFAGLTLAMTGVATVSIASIIQGLDLAAKARAMRPADVAG